MELRLKKNGTDIARETEQDPGVKSALDSTAQATVEKILGQTNSKIYSMEMQIKQLELLNLK